MDERPTFRPFLFSTFVLFIGGWAGLALLMNYTLPTIWPRWGFFALLVLACTGTTIPISFLLNRIFSSSPAADPRVVVRQSIWVGVYFAVLAWLQIGRFLSFSIALWLAIGLIALEYVVRIRETSSASSKSANDVPPQPPVS
jgi:hypothetical protein